MQELESKLKAERAQLKSFAGEQVRYQHEKEEISKQLGMTESVSARLIKAASDHLILMSLFAWQAMAEMKDHLQRLKQENHALETELRGRPT